MFKDSIKIRRIFVLQFIVFGLLNPFFSQDILILRSGDEIQSKIIEVGVTEIKYKKHTNVNGPLYSVLKSDVFMIKYEDGSKDVFKETGGSSAKQENTSTNGTYNSGNNVNSNSGNNSAEDEIGNMVFEAYGTFLETLIKNEGSFNDKVAQNYLNTILNKNTSGYNSGLNVNEISQRSGYEAYQNKQITFDQYVKSINNNLIQGLPSNDKIQMKNDPTIVLNNLHDEAINQKKISVETAASTIAMLIESYQINQQNKAINSKEIERLSLITPRLKDLKNEEGTYIAAEKLHIVEDFTDKSNWKTLNPNLQKEDNYRYAYNKYSFLGSALAISCPTLSTDYLPYNAYKNPKNFDFSKDFEMNLSFSTDFEKSSYFEIWIGKGFFVHLWISDGRYYSIATPKNYYITPKFGEIETSDVTESMKDKRLSMSKINECMIWDTKSAKHLGSIKKYVSNEDIKIQIKKIGTTFYIACSLNDYLVSHEIEYFPDKHYLGFSYNESGGFGKSKSTFLIKRLELKHL